MVLGTRQLGTSGDIMSGFVMAQSSDAPHYLDCEINNTNGSVLDEVLGIFVTARGTSATRAGGNRLPGR